MNLNFSNIYIGILILLLITFLFLFLSKFLSKKNLEDKIIVLEETDKTQSNISPYDISFRLGLSYLQKRQYDKAVQQFENCLNTWNKNDMLSLGVLYNTLGFCYYKSNQLKMAGYYYKQAILLLPDYTSALNNLAMVFERQANKDKAIEMYKKVLSYDSRNLTAKERCLVLSKLN